MALYVGSQTLNADAAAGGVRSYVVLRYRPSTGYTWSRVFVASPFDARARVPIATLSKDGWLFGYFSGDWLRVWGT